MSIAVTICLWVVGIMVVISISPLIIAAAQVLALMVLAGMVWLFASFICLVEIIGIYWDKMILKIKGMCK